MSRCICSFLLVLLCNLTLAGQDDKAKSAPTPGERAGEAYIVEDFINRYSFENDGTATRDSTARVRLQSDAGVQRFGVLIFPYQKAIESVEIEYVRVRKPDGSSVTTPVDDLQDMPSNITREAPFYSDLREKHVAVKSLNVNDVLEYQVHWHQTKSLAPGQFWLAFSFSRDEVVLHEQLQVSIPRDRAIKVKSPSLTPAISDAANRRIYTWTRSNPQVQQKSKIDLLQRAVLGRLDAPEVLLSSFQSWDELGNWYYGLQQDRINPDQEIRNKAAELTRNAPDQLAKIRAIYKYVSTEFHYIGIAFGVGRYQPHAAGEVLSNQYGDCKDKHTLLASLLAAVGIPSYPALINSSHLVDQDVPSPTQFDHLISAVPQGKDILWLDTTPEVGPFGYLLGPLRDKPALVISSPKNSQFQNTPAQPPFPSLWTFKITAKLDDTGTLEVKLSKPSAGTWK